MEIVSIILAFCGGVFGALVGGVTTFVFCGLLALIGIGVILAGGSDVFLWGIAFGPLFGPQVAFSGGVAAAAYWGRKSHQHLERIRTAENDAGGLEMMSDGATLEESLKEKVIEGTNTITPLFMTNHVPVLLVGGIFGVIGYIVTFLLGDIVGLQADNAAIAVTVCGLLSRIVFGSSGLTGKLGQNEKRYVFEPQQLLFNLIWSFAVAVSIAYIIQIIEINVFGFAIGAFSLLFLYFGINFPATHHVSMVAGFAVTVFGNIWIAGLLGMVAMLIGELLTKTFNTKVDSHIDSPAFTIAICSLILLNLF